VRQERGAASLPPVLDLAVAWTWRLAVLAGGLVLVGLALQRVALLTASLLAALLLTALLQPLAAAAASRSSAGRRGRRVAGAAVLVAFLALVGAGVLVLGQVVVAQLPDVDRALSQGYEQALDRLREAGLVDQQQRDRLRQQVLGAVESGSGQLLSGVVAAVGTVLDVVSGVLLALFVTLVLLLDGRTVWEWVLRLLPRDAREPADEAAERAWGALTGWARGIVLVALTDATLVALALLVIGVPSVLPLAALTFLGAFLPYVGAAVAGLAAVATALAAEGPGAALLVLAAVLLVQTVDGYVLEPLVLGRAVRLHPLAVVVVITLGGLLAGIGGAVAAVPLTGAVNEAVTCLARRHRHEDQGPPSASGQRPMGSGEVE
jgi:putative heme transporter